MGEVKRIAGLVLSGLLGDNTYKHGIFWKFLY